MKTIRILLVSVIFLLPFISHAESININTADVQALSKNIKGIGLKKAQSIIAYRKEHGHFNSIEELTKVKGIGAKTVEKNKASLFVSIRPKNKK